MTAQDRARNRAYLAWLEHSRNCAECKRVMTAVEGCETGWELWGAYSPTRTESNTGGGE